MDYQKEIEELHEFLQGYFRGEIEGTARFTDVLSTNFRIISPRGNTLDREGIVHAIESSSGSSPDFEIWIEDVEGVVDDQNFVMVEYTECQRVSDKVTKRRTSVLFRKVESLPNGLEWVHVHETWLPGYGV